MHVHREPVYPLFLWLTRQIAGESSLMLAGILQCALAVFASFTFVRYVLEKVIFKGLRAASDKPAIVWFIALLLTGAVISPYIITPLFSVTHVMLASGILSESLAMPLFLLYVISLHKILTDRSHENMTGMRYAAESFIIAFVMSLTRSQMMVTLIAWLIVTVVSLAVDKKNRIIKIVLVVLIFIISMPFRTTVNKIYNQTFNGRYVDNVYGRLTMLTNIFYATDRETGEYIEDEDLKTLFVRFYDVMDENEWSYKYAGDSAADRAVYLEDMHDKVKFDVLEAGFRDVGNERGMPDYIDYNLMAEEYSGRLIRILIPHCTGRWVADWLIMGVRGVVRSIAVCHPVMYIYVIAVLLFSVVAMIRLVIKAHKTKDHAAYSAAALMLIALLLLFGNAFGTAVTIMCLSRYMIYDFAVFYCALIAIFSSIDYNRAYGT